MSELISDANGIQMPPRTIQRIRAVKRASPRPRPAEDVIRPAREDRQLAERLGDVLPAYEAPDPAQRTGPPSLDCVEPSTERTLDNSDFFTQNNEPRPEIISGLIREGQLAVLAGTYGVGKSPLLSDIMICLVNGIPWCGREVQQRPVIAFDLESSGPTFKRNLTNVARRFRVDLPIVPDDLEAYIEHDAASAPATAKLLELIKEKDLDKRVDFLEEALGRKAEAIIMIDPLELLFRIDTRDKTHVLWLYSRLRNLLARYPKSAVIFTLNLRKKDRRSTSQPDLLTDPRAWLEDVSGSLDILNRCDVRLGIDFNGEDVRVINGVRRGEDMHPLLIRLVGDLPDGLAGFEPCSPTDLTLKLTLTTTQLAYWEKLPQEFRFEEIADRVVPRATLYRLLKKAQSLTIVEERNGVWRKKSFGSAEP